MAATSSRGATWTPEGLLVAVHAPSAELIEVCLFVDGNETRVPLTSRQNGLHQGLIPNVDVGTEYGLRAHGPWHPESGLRFNPDKLLIDPYARAINGSVTWSEILLPGSSDGREPDSRDSAAFMPRGVVVRDDFDWGLDHAPLTSWSDTVIYEMHVKGFTATHPDIPEAQRGTYAGLAHPAAIEYFTRLGVTAVNLLPVHHVAPEAALAARGLPNYWGYSTLGFFAPHAEYSSDHRPGAQIAEFKSMVAALHAAGIEVILDVVYNHTCEGGIDGPSLSLRGLGERDFYKLNHETGAYLDMTGCGNTLDVGRLDVMRLVLDSLRYWVTEMHVDGFRFDLASTLARTHHDFDPHSPFLAAIHQDPILRSVKLIAEPWDLGPGGYQLGSFGEPWSEWNDKYRDDVRAFWLAYPGATGSPADMGSRLTGSQDVLWRRTPTASINFITAHDGFTLHDLVTYNHKHNEANQEDNRDGSDHNRSWNHGTEGESADPAIIASRAATARALLATLLLSTGVPMLSMGDERGRSQNGNNNAYCQDNEISWVDWAPEATDHDLLAWTKALIKLRLDHTTLGRDVFFAPHDDTAPARADLRWLCADGTPMTHSDWHNPNTNTLVMVFHGATTPDYDITPTADATLVIALNRAATQVDLTLPNTASGRLYRRILDTALSRPDTGSLNVGGRPTPLAPRSVTVFQID